MGKKPQRRRSFTRGGRSSMVHAVNTMTARMNNGNHDADRVEAPEPPAPAAAADPVAVAEEPAVIANPVEAIIAVEEEPAAAVIADPVEAIIAEEEEPAAVVADPVEAIIAEEEEPAAAVIADPVEDTVAEEEEPAAGVVVKTKEEPRGVSPTPSGAAAAAGGGRTV